MKNKLARKAAVKTLDRIDDANKNSHTSSQEKVDNEISSSQDRIDDANKNSHTSPQEKVNDEISSVSVLNDLHA